MASSTESTPDQLALTFAAVGVVIRRIEPDQWASATPCTEWSVRRVVGHLIGMNLVFAAMLADEAMPARVDIADEDLAAQYGSSAELLVSRFSSPGTLERGLGGPMGSASGAERLQIRLYDLIAHGWDLARATRQSMILPDDVVEDSLAFATVQLAGIDRDGRFRPAQTCPDSADSVDRLAAFLGRDVNWAVPVAGQACERRSGGW
jgi:uncharacterized protein (TIGR03086 family)